MELVWGRHKGLEAGMGLEREMDCERGMGLGREMG